MENSLVSIATDKALDIVKEKGESLIKTLFGSSFDELGGMIADQIRYQRFKNQVVILGKAEKHLKSKGIQPKKISLKVLVPMIDSSSLEEDEYMQDKWADLIANALTRDIVVSLQQKAIDVLKNISTEEFKMLETLLLDAEKERVLRHERYKSYRWTAADKKITDYDLGDFDFSYGELEKLVEKSRNECELSISNLVTYGLLRWKSEVEVSSNNKSIDLGIDDEGNPKSEDIIEDVSASIDNNKFALTKFGEDFLKIYEYDK